MTSIIRRAGASQEMQVADVHDTNLSWGRNFAGRFAAPMLSCLAFAALLWNPIACSLFAQGNQNVRVDTEVVMIDDAGFRRGSILRAPGRFVLLLVNQSRVASLTVELDQMPGENLNDNPIARIKRPEVPARSRRHAEILELATGVYRLRVAEQPSRLLRLEIKPQYGRVKTPR